MSVEKTENTGREKKQTDRIL